MDPERWKRIDEIFHAVLDREVSERAAFVDEACEGDDSLRSELERLLVCHEQESKLFDHPPSDLAAALLAPQNTSIDIISHYRILRKIGSGGMGEVYLAEDTRLNRKVALKILPLEFTKDQNRIRRFEREAQAVSTLNHPNILTIYDIGQTDSSSFIASEYIDGTTLRQHMRISKMSLKEILTVVIQVAEALNAAHQAGIIHRDIKPENIMLRSDGYVKVLDFGLAKLIESQPRPEGSKLETVTSTQTGIVIGTVRYMSPEQARGLKIDERTDIFSLGVVLYEMIAGRAPFDGATTSDVIAAILEKQPQALNTSGELPEELQWIVTKALAKDCEDRYQSEKDFLTDLRRIRKQLDINEELKLGTRKVVPNVQKPRKTFALILAILVAFIGLVLAIKYHSRNFQEPKKPFTKIRLSKLTNSGLARGGVISPDGKYAAYIVQDQGLYLRLLSTDTEIQILKLPPESWFYGGRRFSLDGNFIYYLLDHGSPDGIVGALYKVPVLGGISVKLIENINFVPALSPDGKKLAFARDVNQEHWLMTAEADGSNQKKIKTRRSNEYYTDLEWSPDGKIIAAILHTHEKEQIVGIDLNSLAERVISNWDLPQEYQHDLAWVADGTGLLIATAKDGKRQIFYLSYPQGQISAVTNDFNEYSGVTLTNDSKYIITNQSQFQSTIWTASSSKPDTITQITSGSSFLLDGHWGLSWTQDGKILYSSREANGDQQLVLVNPDGTNRTRITTGNPGKYWPVASLDGSLITYMSLKGEIWRIDKDGDNPKLLSDSKKYFRFPRFSPDSKWIVCSTTDEPKQELVRLHVDSGKKVVLASQKLIYSGPVSPDGSRIAYMDYGSDSQAKLNVISFEDGKLIRSFPIDPDSGVNAGAMIQWTPDGKGIAYIQESSNIYVQHLNGAAPYALTDLKSKKILGFAWSQDGKHIAYSIGKDVNDVVLIENLP